MTIEISLHADGIYHGIPVAREQLEEAEAAPGAFIDRHYGAESGTYSRYLTLLGVIQCEHPTGKGQCKNKFGVHNMPGRVAMPFPDWLKLHRAGWYCQVHGGGSEAHQIGPVNR